ncbi:MAG: glutamate--tRNA ligase [Deltaproteobacteria bacterium]|uniref:Glutamate--tRNA ligase n=1 Tax=Candidatus Zymogenus saltonus TaxID=2844893 RepID=A0A9D8KDZ0_9DELT|nr:glutamate--tRNA ligase [Candidatus Zymogenus saltonus]
MTAGGAPVRVRFAPSPTGPLHLGNARIAIVNHLFKLKTKGALVLRIEDTDPERFDPSSEKLIHDELKWLGITPDEGPNIGGDFGPYRQGERGDIYRKFAEALLEEGFCFKCFCADEELEIERKAAVARGLPPRYSGRCRNLTSEEMEVKGETPFTIRFRVETGPGNREIVVNDLVHKRVVFTTEAFGDFIILRADGSAVYNFSSAIDDHLMGITHVIRGEDHLPNTPRQVLIYRALKATPPVFAHLPLLLSADGEKLKKRGGRDPNLEELKETGYTRDAILNYLASIGNPAFSAGKVAVDKEIADRFEIKRLGRSAVKVDVEKLKGINRRHLRGLSRDGLSDLISPFLKSDGFDFSESELKEFSEAIRENITLLEDARRYSPVFFKDLPEIESDAEKILAGKNTKNVLESFLATVEPIENLTREAYGKAVKEAMEKAGIKGKDFFMPLRAALTGITSGPELEAVAAFIGIKRVRERICRALKQY